MIKSGLLINGSGAIVFVASYDSVSAPGLIEKFRAKGIEKYIVYELPTDEIKKRYGAHSDVVLQDLAEANDLRILDYDGTRAFNMFSFSELGEPVFIE